MKTKKFYDKIADSWYNIRHYSIFTDELEKISKKWTKGKLLNIGCAHGSDFLPFKEGGYELYGTDISKNLLNLANKYSDKFVLETKLFAADMTNLPITDNSFDHFLAIASLHHLIERNDRLNALREMKRILKKGGQGLITVWNKWNMQFLTKDKIIDREWNYKGQKVSRKYYLYDYFELKSDLKEAGFKIKKLYPEDEYNIPIKYFSKNIIALVEK